MGENITQSILSPSVVWEGRPSQLINFWIFVLLFWTVIFPLLAWLKIRFTKYELKSDRFFESSGILFQTTDQVELIRVRDYQVTKTLTQRIFSIGNITLITRDEKNKIITLKWVKNPDDLIEIIRGTVESSKKGSRYFEGETH